MIPVSALVAYLKREPVRLYLYAVALAVVALLVVLGVLSASIAPVVLALVAAVLAVPTTESLRARVTPTKK